MNRNPLGIMSILNMGPQQRVLSETDTTTCRLNQRQIQQYADMPIEVTEHVPYPTHKVIFDNNGGVEYRALVPVPGRGYVVPISSPVYAQGVGNGVQ